MRLAVLESKQRVSSLARLRNEKARVASSHWRLHSVSMHNTEARERVHVRTYFTVEEIACELNGNRNSAQFFNDATRLRIIR
jgi:hypothetical protein